MFRRWGSFVVWGVMSANIAFAQTYHYYDDEAPRATTPYHAPAANPPVVAAPVCERCGTVTQIERLNNAPPTAADDNPSVGGLLAGGVVGALLGSQVGRGSGKKAATLLGAAGGAYVGNMIAKGQLGSGATSATSTVNGQRVSVRFDDGSRQMFDNPALSDLQVGERVQWQQGRLIRLPASSL